MNLLLLRGLIRDQRCWGDFPNRLSAQAPHLNLHYLDLPGVGTENTRECPDSVTAVRIDVAKRFHEEIAKGKFPKGPWSILGISFGGMLAINWAAAEPDLFKNLIVINTSAADVAGFRDRFRFQHLPGILRVLITGRPEDSEKLILRLVSNRFPEMTQLLDRQIQWRKERPVSRTTFLRQLYGAARFHLPPERLKPRSIVISSDGDRLVSPQCSARLADRLAVPRLSHPWSGHDIPIDDPEWLARQVQEFIPDPLAPQAKFRT